MATLLARLAKDGKINGQASMRDVQSKIINAPIEKVWKTVSNISEWPTWNKEITIIKAGQVEANE